MFRHDFQQTADTVLAQITHSDPKLLWDWNHYRSEIIMRAAREPLSKSKSGFNVFGLFTIPLGYSAQRKNDSLQALERVLQSPKTNLDTIDHCLKALENLPIKKPLQQGRLGDLYKRIMPIVKIWRERAAQEKRNNGKGCTHWLRGIF